MRGRVGPRADMAQQLRTDLARELFRRAQAFGFSGGFQLHVSGSQVLADGYGMAWRSRGIPVEPDTLFDIGSVAKQFTAAAILRLEESGRLRVEDPIRRHLPDVPPDKHGITVHHLLTHSSGLPANVGVASRRPTRSEAVREILSAPLEAAPGARYRYSNAGYVLLAAIVERASGRSFERFLREELWLPAGMTRTGMVLGDLASAPVAEGYNFDGPVPANIYLAEPRDGPSWLVRGAGYMLSTMEDLGRWGEALRTGTVLSDASRRKLFRPHIREDGEAPSYYGYGWTLSAARDGSCRIGHNGSAGVHYAFMSFLPERDAVVVSFMTQQRSPWRYFINRAYAALLGDAPNLPDVAERRRDELQPLTGDYRLPNSSNVPVRMEQGRLFIETVNADILRLFSPWPLVQPERAAVLGDRQALISSVMDGISRGDFAPLLTRLRPGIDPAEERRWWQERWPQWTARWGRYLGADLAGTVQTGDDLRSLALLRFTGGTVAVGLIHSPDGRIYVDWMQQQLVRHHFLAPQEDGSFLAYNVGTRRGVRVRFAEGARPGQLVIQNDQEEARAVAMPAR